MDGENIVAKCVLLNLINCRADASQILIAINININTDVFNYFKHLYQYLVRISFFHEWLGCSV